MRARIVIATLAAVLGAILAFALRDRRGDEPRAIADFEQKLDAAFVPRIIFSPPVGVTAPRHTYLLSAADGRLLEIDMDDPPTDAEAEPVFAAAAAVGSLSSPPPTLKGKLGKVVQIAPAWSELQPLWAALVWSNKQVAEARALRRYSERPETYPAYQWDRRIAEAAKPWQLESRSRLLMGRFGYAVGGAIGAFLVMLLLLAALVWSWHFLLARIREVSQAVRGR